MQQMPGRDAYLDGLLGDQLETFRSAVDFELFRPELNAALSYTDRTEGGRPPFDPVLMFKILVIQATNNLSDERAEFLINDRLSFMRFLGLGLEDRVPDARTIWLFREKLTTAGAIKRLFEQFDAMLRQAGYIAMSGQIVDASLVAAPRQRNTDDEKKAIKEGRIPPNWKAKPAKMRHKDRDARWTVKFTKAKPRQDGSTPPVDLAIPLFGYQNHVSIDRRFGFIRRWAATDAAAYEGRRLRQASLRSVFTIIADNAAFTCRVSSRTVSNPARFSPACSHCDNGPASSPIRFTAKPSDAKKATRASGSLATFASLTILPYASTTHTLESSNDTSIPA